MSTLQVSKNKNNATDVVVNEIPQTVVEIDPRRYTVIGWLIVLFGVGGFLLWAFFAPLDKGVPINGTVVVSTNRKAVQHPTGGTIQDILVKEGDIVKTGQVLVRMNSVQATAALEMTRGQYFTARAAEARLTAERDGKSSVKFPSDLESMKKDPRVTEVINLQYQLFSARKSALQNEMAAVNENMESLRIQTRGLEQARENKKRQLSILNEQLEGLHDLSKDGYVARNRVLDLERTKVQIEGAIADDISNISRSQRQVAELTLRRAQRLQEYQKEVNTQLADAQKEAEALQNRMGSQEYDLSNVEIKSPANGSVVGITVFTKGGVVGPGVKMMDVVPSGDELIAEGQVPVNLIDKVHAGLPVELIFTAFNSNKTPHVPGIVTQISADRMVEERSGAPFYKLKAKVTPEGMKLLAKHEIRAGMPVDLFVKTGERSMMNYLLQPLINRANTSLTEE